MKKLLLALSLSPLAVMGQQFNANPISQDKDLAVSMKPYTQDGGIINSPVRIHKENPHPRQKTSRAYPLNAVQVGTTFYDLATNGSMPRRILAYPGSKISVVWTNSSIQNQDFIDRGTGYNHFDGTSWVGQVVRDPSDTTKFEAERAGWPNIVPFNDNGTQKELIVSHYAAGGTGVSGGTFWMKNSGIGKTDFKTFLTKDKPSGPIWPRIAITDNIVHWIGVYSDVEFVKEGVKSPMVYYRYNTTTNTFEDEAILLPGYKERVARGTGDEYSIDARGNTVAILAGGMVNDLTLWKSTDKGETWTMTIIDSFPLAPYDATSNTPFDTTWTNDGTGNVTLDNNGVAHVTFSRVRVIEADNSNTGYEYFPGTDGLVYWNDQTKDTQLIAARINYDGDVDTDIRQGTTASGQGGYLSGLSSFSVSAVDADNNIYVVYSSPNEEDVTPDEETNFRDLYVVYSTDNGASWSEIQSITGSAQEEDVFPSVARDVVDGKLHLLWMRDEVPGIFLINEVEVVQNYMMYAAIPVDDILDNKLGLARVGIDEKNKLNNVFSIGEVYPNPASSMVTVPVNMKTAAQVSLKVIDMLG
ncbi:MAG: hypothetical protein ACXWDO_05965, partial [Bacteroidia bacterium]